MTQQETLTALGFAAVKLKRAITRLEDRIDDDTLEDGERAELVLQLPTLEADRRALDAQIAALAAGATAFIVPPDGVVEELKTATTALADAIGSSAEVSTLLGLARSVVAVARQATG